MNDLDICKRIAEIEGVAWMPAYPNQPNEFVGLIGENDLCGTPPELIGKYDPLTDKALCFDLMVKYELDLQAPYRPNSETEWEVMYWIDGVSDAGAIRNENPQKAICLAIIAKHGVSYETK